MGPEGRSFAIDILFALHGWFYWGFFALVRFLLLYAWIWM